jgi:hypothetical protein
MISLGHDLVATPHEVVEGKETYQVRYASKDNVLFTGTMPEIRRWKKIHLSKTKIRQRRKHANSIDFIASLKPIHKLGF